VTLKCGLQVTQITENGTTRTFGYRFLFVILRSIVTMSCIIFEIKQDTGLKSRFFHTPAFDTTVRGSPSEYCHNVECGITRMVWRPDDDKTVIRLAVLTQYRRVTDGRTDIV